MKNADIAMIKSGFERVEGDRYWTERWVTQALLDRVKFRGDIWEPACGRGDMVNVLRSNGYTVVASDIAGKSLGCADAAGMDFLMVVRGQGTHRSIVTNPPYALSDQFIYAAIKVTKAARMMVAMLLRNEFDCAARRRDIFERPEFAQKLVLTKRPRWVEMHTADPRHNFAWYVWDHAHSGPATIDWLP